MINKIHIIIFLLFMGHNVLSQHVLYFEVPSCPFNQVEELEEENFSFEVYPNHANTDFKISFYNSKEKEDNIRLQIIGITGNVVKSKNINISPGLNKFDFKRKDFASGTYIVRVITDETVINTKFILD